MNKCNIIMFLYKTYLLVKNNKKYIEIQDYKTKLILHPTHGYI